MRYIVIGALIVVALVSAFPLREIFSSPSTYEGIIATLDEKKGNVTAMVATSTAASAGISLIPGDAGTPLAQKLMDISSSLMIVLAVIYLEKCLLTVFGLVTFGFIAPICCGLAIVWVWCAGRNRFGVACGRLACKLVALGIVLMLTVPASVQVSNMIDQTYADSLRVSESIQPTEDDAADEEESNSGFDPIGWFLGVAEDVQNGVQSLTTDMIEQVNKLIEGMAVMVVTSCLIPIVVLLFFLGMAKLVLGINIDVPMATLKAQGERLKSRPQRIRASKVTAKTEG